MQLEIHILQSFPPANLNRDENGMPKSTVFGGRPRARISSQCQKRATRQFYQDNAKLSAEQFAYRSRNWVNELKIRLIEQSIDEKQAEIASKLTIKALTEKEKKKGKGEAKGEDDDNTQKDKTKSDTILFLGHTEMAGLAKALINNWSDIEQDLSGDKPSLPKDFITKGIIPSIRPPKTTDKNKSEYGKPGDVALFGRMMAVLPQGNVDAAVQVAHAISVNTLEQEFDFFTAVDDLAASDDSGADHMGETGYNSSTYYRYANLDTVQLTHNLGSQDQVSDISKAFAEAFIKAIPTGHQNGFAAHSKPQAVMIVVRQDQPVSLVNAFEAPIRPNSGLSLLEKSVKALDEHWADMVKMYGESSVQYKGIVTCTKLEQYLKALEAHKVDSLEELLEQSINAAFADEEE